MAVFAALTLAITGNRSLALDSGAFDTADDLRAPWLDNAARRRRTAANRRRRLGHAPRGWLLFTVAMLDAGFSPTPLPTHPSGFCLRLSMDPKEKYAIAPGGRAHGSVFVIGEMVEEPDFGSVVIVLGRV